MELTKANVTLYYIPDVLVLGIRTVVYVFLAFLRFPDFYSPFLFVYYFVYSVSYLVFRHSKKSCEGVLHSFLQHPLVSLNFSEVIDE